MSVCPECEYDGDTLLDEIADLVRQRDEARERIDDMEKAFDRIETEARKWT